MEKYKREKEIAMELNQLFDKQTLDAILADAKANGISEEEVKSVLGILTDDTKAPTRSANTQGELTSLLSDDQDAVTGDIAAAAGVERGKTGTILMLAAPFLLKYLFSGSGSQQQQQSSGSLLGSLLGLSQPQQQVQQQSMGGMGDLLNLMGGMGGTQQTQQSSSLLGSLLGMGTQQQTPTYTSSSTANLLGSLLGGGTQQQTQNVGSMNDLMSLMSGMSGTQQSNSLFGTQQTQQNAGGGLLSALFNLLGDT
jgi:hypothetical protein